MKEGENQRAGSHPQGPKPFGFNVIGYIGSDVGIGVSARNIVRLLVEKGYAVATLDIDPDHGKHGRNSSLDRYAVESIESLPYAVNLICISLHALPAFLSGQRALLSGDFLNVGVIYWELTVLPRLWVMALELLDVVLTTSTFVRATLEAHLSKVCVVYAAYPNYMPSGIQSSRARYRLPEDATLFVNSFDPYSDVQRKNPFGLVQAFQNAFQEKSNVGLVMKLNAPRTETRDHYRSGVAAELRTRCAGDPRIHLIEDPLDYGQILGLYAACDVFVSVHRSEGLGLGLMESMALGKPVIATGWSGNMTFMDHTNSCLVRYKLVPAKGASWVYRFAAEGKNALWAEPDLGDASAWMRRLADQPELRASIGKNAAQDIACFHGDALRGVFIEEVRAIWEQRMFLPERSHGTKQDDYAKFQLTARDYAASPPKRMVRKALRIADRHFLWRFRSRA